MKCYYLATLNIKVIKNSDYNLDKENHKLFHPMHPRLAVGGAWLFDCASVSVGCVGSRSCWSSTAWGYFYLAFGPEVHCAGWVAMTQLILLFSLFHFVGALLLFELVGGWGLFTLCSTGDRECLNRSDDDFSFSCTGTHVSTRLFLCCLASAFL